MLGYVDFILRRRMENEKLEFFNLDEIDRKVFLWLLDHVPQKSIMAWIEYVSEEYHRTRSVQIDGERMYSEMKN
ncbi:hypothetical protein [Pseudochryseolinea flava]|uniref:Uncharacterized protein n=1 Tax=Pseudochryseolinea flava TaxID=2059302 RepID=A0A364Y4E1_9BACT|nr:hypothetical protein [Pseudochryseolinea flava]RAW01747.1 hypothetical protein DQQ10_08855 [Pseudochryseolinea flava]